MENCNDCKFWKQIKGHFRTCGFGKKVGCGYFMEDGTEEREKPGASHHRGGRGSMRVSWSGRIV